MDGSRAKSENGRRLVHLAFGLPAFALPFMDWRLALLIALCALVVNLEFLPRTTLGRRWFREGESALGGIALYPLTVTILIIIFRRDLEIAAIGWIVLAVGDPAAAWAGGAGRRPLPWNGNKTWRGSGAFVVTAGIAALLLQLLAGREAGVAMASAAAAAAIGAAVESLPRPRVDNLVVGFGASFSALLVRLLV